MHSCSATPAPSAAAAAAAPVRAAWVSKFGDSITMSYAVYKQELVTVSVCEVVKRAVRAGLNIILVPCCTAPT